MSHLGAPPVTPAPAAPPPPEQDTTGVPGWILVVATLVALAMVGALAYAVLGGGPTTPPAPAAAGQHRQRHYPKHWDRRIAPYARIAARMRGLEFEHPVPVRFVAPAAFARSMREQDKGQAEADRRKAEQATGLLRAFGLLSGDTDLQQADDAFDGSAVLAYYSFKDQRITVRGHVITPSVKSTLVHELTHVLQDQHFHIGARMRAMQKQARKGPTSSAADMLRAVAEGDAVRVQALYRASLPAAQARALAAGEQSDLDQAQSALGRIPKIVVTLNTAPYTLGEGLARAAAAYGGNHAVNALLRQTPVHDIALLKPLDSVDGTLTTHSVQVPAVGAGEKKFQSGELGALTWYLLLAARMAPRTALTAADGWAGDAYVGYRGDGRTCARMTFAGRSAAATTRMTGALQQWVAAGRAGAAHLSTAGRGVTLESCDPGTGVRSGTDDSDEAVTLVAVRAALAVDLVRRGEADFLANCLADQMVQTFSVPALENPTFGVNDPGTLATVQRLAAACR